MQEADDASPAIRRLIALLGSGYKIDQRTTQEVRDTIWLEHPARRRMVEHTLLLFEDGLVVGMDRGGGTKQLRIAADEADSFRLFVSAIPKPTWWEVNQDSFFRGAAWVGFVAVALMLWTVITFVEGMFQQRGA